MGSVLPSDVEVRRAIADDAVAIRKLLASFGYHRDDLDHVRQRVNAAPGPSGPHVLVARHNERVIGVASFNVSFVLKREHPQARLSVIVVDCALRKHGVGRRLIEAAEEQALGFGCSRLELTSADTLPGAHAFLAAARVHRNGAAFRPRTATRARLAT